MRVELERDSVSKQIEEDLCVCKDNRGKGLGLEDRDGRRSNENPGHVDPGWHIGVRVGGGGPVGRYWCRSSMWKTVDVGGVGWGGREVPEVVADDVVKHVVVQAS